MARTMYDSTTATDIPAGSPLVLGYVDGGPGVEWSAADWHRFPGRVVARAAIYNDRFDAQVLDVEAGNNGADGALFWIKGKWDRGETPTVYCSGDGGPKGYRLSDVRAACDAAGVRRPLILLAQWDNNPATFDPSGDAEIIGKQFANSAMTGGHFDQSIVADVWPGVDPKPAPAHFTPPPLFSQSDDLTIHVGAVGELAAEWSYLQPDGTYKEKPVLRKVWAQIPGRRVYTIFPQVDPDSDPTECLDGEPAIFVVDVIATP